MIGASTAYHPAHFETDVLLLEQGTLSCGNDGTRPGLPAAARRESGTGLVQHSADLYQQFEAETGLSTGYRQCGGP